MSKRVYAKGRSRYIFPDYHLKGKGQLNKTSKFYKRSTKKRSYRNSYKGNSIMSVAERQYVNAVTNPFGNNKVGALSFNPKIPDPTASRSFPVTLTGTETINPTTHNNRALIKLGNLTDDEDHIAAIYYNSSGDDQPSPNATAFIDSTAWSIIRASTNRYRIVGAGIKVLPTSGDNDTSGTVRGGNPYTGGYMATTYNTFENVYQELEPYVYSAHKGCTVRYVPNDPAAFQYEDIASYDATTFTHGFKEPALYIEDIGDNTRLTVQVVLHVECQANDLEFPVAQVPSPVSPQWSMLYAAITDPKIAPIVTTGNSFYDVVRKIWNWIFRNRRHLVNAAGALAPMMY